MDVSEKAVPSNSLPAPEAVSPSSSSPAPAASYSSGPAEDVPSSPRLAGVEADRASQVSGSGCTSQASVDDDDDVPITDIYFVSENLAKQTCLKKCKISIFFNHLVFFSHLVGKE